MAPSSLVTDAFYRYTDIVFEWHKLLPQQAAGAVKALVNSNALIHPDHPLRLPHNTGVELYIGLFPDKKARLMFSYRQIEYLRYYIQAVGLYDNDVIKLGDHDADEDCEDGLFALPSSPQFLFEGQMVKMVSAVFDTFEKLKTAVRNPLKVYRLVEAGTFESTFAKKTDDGGVESETKSAPSTPNEAAGVEGIEVGPSVIRPPGPATTFFHAEQAYIVANQGGQSPSYAPGHVATNSFNRPAGRGCFLTIEFESWELELGVVLDLGWAACWFEQGKGKSAMWEEKLDQGHWVVEEHLKYTDESITGKDRIEYLYGATEKMSLETFQKKVAGLIPELQAKLGPGGGPIYLVVHSTARPLEMLGLLDLPYETFHQTMQPEGFVAPAYATRKGNGEVFVLDLAEMVAALENDREDGEDKLKTEMTLREVWEIVCQDYPETNVGFGNSGNDAWLLLNAFLVLVAKKFEMAKTDFVLVQMKMEEDAEVADTREWKRAMSDNDADDGDENQEDENDVSDEDEEENPVEFSFKALEVDIGLDGPEADSDFDPWEMDADADADTD